MPASNRRRTSAQQLARSVRLGVVFVALIGVNLYFFLFRRGTSLPQLIKAAEIRRETVSMGPGRTAARPGGVAAAAQPVEPTAEGLEEGQSASGMLAPSDTVAALLRREGVAPAVAATIEQQLGRVMSLHGLRSPMRYLLRRDSEERLRSFELRPTAAVGFRAERRGAASWRATRISLPLTTHAVEVSGSLADSLYETLSTYGEPPQLASAIADVLAWDVALQSSALPGDRFRVIVEKHHLGDRFYQLGRILAAEYVNPSGTFRAFWYERSDSQGAGGYYTDHGEALSRSLLQSPLKYVPIAHRAHDQGERLAVLQTDRGRLGLELPAASGTPVCAVADGKVSASSGSAAAGYLVVLTHPGGMETSYLHLGRLAREVRIGEMVRQKQVIGYVAPRAAAKRARIHYAVKLGGHFVDPRRLRPARAAPLPSAERATLARVIAPYLARFAQNASPGSRPFPGGGEKE